MSGYTPVDHEMPEWMYVQEARVTAPQRPQTSQKQEAETKEGRVQPETMRKGVGLFAMEGPNG